MSGAIAIARTGLSAATLRLDSAAHNIANALTPNFRRQGVVQQSQASGGVMATPTFAGGFGANLTTDRIDQITATYAFKANLQAIRVQDLVLGSLLKVRV